MKSICTLWLVATAIAFLSAIEATARPKLSVRIETIETNTLRVLITNEGEKATKILPLESDPSWTIDIWIEDKEGKRISSDLFGDGNWYNNPCPISDMSYYTKKIPKIKLRSRESHAGTFILSDALRYLGYQPTKEKLNQIIEEGTESWLKLLPEATNQPYDRTLEERLDPSKGPFRLKVRWGEIESNWIQLERIEFEPVVPYNSGQSLRD